MTRRAEIPVRFDYTFERLQALARLCATRAFSATLDPLERADVAWMGIAEHLYEATDRPTPAELLHAGTRAIHDWSWADHQAHGACRNGRYVDAGANHRFAMYWWQRSFPSFEDGVVDRVAMAEIWPLLKDWQQEALVALAVHENFDAAAAALGLPYYTYCMRVWRARARFLRAWHEGEKPASPKRDRRIHKRGQG